MGALNRPESCQWSPLSQKTKESIYLHATSYVSPFVLASCYVNLNYGRSAAGAEMPMVSHLSLLFTWTKLTGTTYIHAVYPSFCSRRGLTDCCCTYPLHHARVVIRSPTAAVGRSSSQKLPSSCTGQKHTLLLFLLLSL